jgi:hypothetical protein
MRVLRALCVASVALSLQPAQAQEMELYDVDFIQPTYLFQCRNLDDLYYILGASKSADPFTEMKARVTQMRMVASAGVAPRCDYVVDMKGEYTLYPGLRGVALLKETVTNLDSGKTLYSGIYVLYDAATVPMYSHFQFPFENGMIQKGFDGVVIIAGPPS